MNEAAWFNPKQRVGVTGGICPWVQVRRLFTPNLAGPMPARSGRVAMQDVIMLLFTAAFFTLAFVYVKACQKLR